MTATWKFVGAITPEAFVSGKPALAVRALHTAVSELRRAAKNHPRTAAQGALTLLELLGPALAPVDETSGSLAHALARTLDSTIEVVGSQTADVAVVAGLDRLGASVLSAQANIPQSVHQAISQRWGRLCGSPQQALRWAEKLLPEVVDAWSKPEGYAPGGVACLSSLCACERFEELLNLLEHRPIPVWLERQFGVQALVSLGQVEEALAYAQASNPLGHHYDREIAKTCEALLLGDDQRQRAYRLFAIAANQRQNCLQTYRALAGKYPEVPADELLGDLLASTPGDEGRWFATARHLRFFQLALELASQTPCDPKTLNRAARDHLIADPSYAGALARAALRWVIAGYGVEISAEDVYASLDLAKRALRRVDDNGTQLRQLKHELKVQCAAPTEAASWVRSLLHYELAD